MQVRQLKDEQAIMQQAHWTHTRYDNKERSLPVERAVLPCCRLSDPLASGCCQSLLTAAAAAAIFCCDGGAMAMVGAGALLPAGFCSWGQGRSTAGAVLGEEKLGSNGAEGIDCSCSIAACKAEVFCLPFCANCLSNVKPYRF